MVISDSSRKSKRHPTRGDLSSSRMQLRGVVKQGREQFEDREAFADAAAALERVQEALAHLRGAAVIPPAERS